LDQRQNAPASSASLSLVVLDRPCALASKIGYLDCGTSSLGRQYAQKGKAVANVCLACHSISPGAQNKIGPELNGLDGRHSGSVPNFKYTKDYTDPGLVWNKETFEKYIKNPRAMFPDTTMIFPGIQDAQQIDDLWAYLSQYDEDGNIKK
jgi:cytochrome c